MANGLRGAPTSFTFTPLSLFPPRCKLDFVPGCVDVFVEEVLPLFCTTLSLSELLDVDNWEPLLSDPETLLIAVGGCFSMLQYTGQDPDIPIKMQALRRLITESSLFRDWYSPYAVFICSLMCANLCFAMGLANTCSFNAPSRY